MTGSGAVRELTALFAEWNMVHKNRGWSGFVSDGFVDPAAYENTFPRICFFLKEAYSKESTADWSLSDWLAGGAMTRMWGTVAEWAYGISQTTMDSIPHKPKLSQDEKTAVLKTVSVVKVKKSNGNVQSDYGDLLRYAVADQTILRRELEILRPDVIVCGNNSGLLRLLYGAKVQENGKISGEGRIPYSFLHENGYALMGDQIILDFYHPANQYPSLLNYYTICGLFQQALKYQAGEQNVFQTK